MISALLTSLFWAISAIFGQRAARYLGSILANFTRLVVAFLILGLITLTLFRDSIQPTPFAWLLLSGLVGFGIGDIGLYLAYARVGSRITMLVTFCLAPVIAAYAEWAWLGTRLDAIEILSIVIIVVGVSQSLRPSSPSSERYGSFTFGICMTLISATGQGLGAVLTRVANEKAAELALDIPAFSQAFQRIIPGLLVSGIFLLVLRVRRRIKLQGIDGWKPKYAGWILGTALCGPIIGLGLYQHALKTTASAIVLAVIASTPIVLMPIAYYFEKDRPTVRTVIGALVAVAGIILLGLYRTWSK